MGINSTQSPERMEAVFSGILSDTCWWIPKASCSKPGYTDSAKVMDYEGIKALLERADEAFPRLRHVCGWMRALPRGGQGG